MPDMCNCRGLHAGFTVVVLFFFFFTSATSVLSSCLVSLAHFPRFCWQCFSLSTTFSMHLARHTYFLLCSGFGIFLKCSVVLHAKSNRYLQKTAAIFLLNFVVQTALIWLVLVGFFCFFQPIRDHLKFALVLQENCSPFSANQKWVIFSCTGCFKSSFRFFLHLNFLIMKDKFCKPKHVIHYLFNID